MIGYYNYTVILTFMSLISAAMGMTLAIEGHMIGAVTCLALSGFFDMLDGPVARTKQDRSHDERLFGIQLHYLVDLVAFGVLPAVICYCLGVRGPLGTIALIYYLLAGTVRLGYFNVRETNFFFSEEEHEKVYIGLPITAIAAILPALFILSVFLTEPAFNILLIVMLFGMGTAFIANFKIHKPKMSVLIVICVIVLAFIVATFVLQAPDITILAR